MKINFRVEIFKDGDTYVSLCPELGVSSFGDTKSEARKSLKEAVELFIEECEGLGTLQEVLQEAGFSPKKNGKGKEWVSPKPVSIETLSLSNAI